MLLIAGFFAGCNPEIIKIKSNIKNSQDGIVLVKMKLHKKIGERILDTLTLVSGDFDFYSEAIKPPVKLTFVVNDEEEFDVWLGNYGTFHIEGESGKLSNVQVQGSHLHDEFKRIHTQFYDTYLEPVQDKIDWLNSLNEKYKGGKPLKQDDSFKKVMFEKDVKKARKYRRLSIIKTMRRNPHSEVALALLNDEFDSLIPRHQKEMINLFKGKFGNTAMFWQLRP